MGRAMIQQNTQEYLLRALVYAGSWGLAEPFECATMTGRDVADFLTRAVSDQAVKKNTVVLHGVHTATWWSMFRRAYEKLGDLDEMRVSQLLETSGNWFWGQKPANSKQMFSTHNFGKIYDRDLALNGWRLVYSQRELRTIVDRFNGAK